jgi:alpha-tubulin suppressor-like RCC1 family protein
VTGTPGRSLYGDIKAAGNNVAQVSAGWGYHRLTVRSDGTVWAWGLNWFGEVGDGTTTNRATPVQVTGLAGVVRGIRHRSHGRHPFEENCSSNIIS